MQRLQDFPDDLPKFTKPILKALETQFMTPSNLQILDVVLDYLARFQVPMETDDGPLSWALMGRFGEESLKLINFILPLAALVNKGVDVNYVGFRGRSAVSKAVAKNQLENLKLLVEAGADLAVPISGEVEEESLLEAPPGNLLLLAAFHGYIDIMKFLLEHGLDVNFTSSEGRTALAPLIIETYHKTNNTFPGCAALFAAVQGGHAAIVQLLLGRGANTELFKPDSRYFLHYAAHRKAAGVVRVLVQAGCNPILADAAEFTPVQYSDEDDDTVGSSYFGR
ncbi:ankyrin repeat-containing domain protein [Aspergillus filifer]